MKLPMNSLLPVFLLSLCAAPLLFAPVCVAGTAGLWMATVSVNRVGEVNPKLPDSIFDLGVSAQQPERELFGAGATWSYSDSGTLEPDWQNTAPFSAWPAAKAPLGYTLGSDGSYQAPETGSLVSFGADPANKNLTVYFRRSFTVSDKAGLASLRMRGWFHDSIKLFVNGAPVAATEMSNRIAAGGYRELSIPISSVVEGANSIAAEVYVPGADHTDLLFDMQLDAVPKQPEVLIPGKSAGWKYDDGEKTALPVAWSGAAFGDGAWKSGAAPLGFGRGTGQIATTVNNAPLVYYRKTVSVTAAEAARYGSLNLNLLRDDGAVVYLNGREIMRSNMPSGTLAFDTPPDQAVSSTDGERYQGKTVPLASGDLVAGDNVFAVEIRQYPAESGTGSATLGERTPTSADFPLRLLLHDDGKGTVRLLKEAIAMKDDTTKKLVALADSALVPGFTGVVLRDDTMVGLRTSTVGYDFNGSTKDCTGALGAGGSLQCNFTLAPDDPGNPFLHRFHPDHDNLDDSFSAPAAEAYQIVRGMKLSFAGRYPANPDEPERSAASTPPGWGDSELGGTYSETISGLHKETLSVSGWFTMKLVAAIADLRR